MKRNRSACFRRSASLSLVLLLLIGLLSACGGQKQPDPPAANGGDAPPAESGGEAEPAGVTGKLMIYTSAEDAFISEVCAQFNVKYPGAQAEYYRSGTEEVVSKILAEK